MGDLHSKKMIVVKGMLFALLVAAGSAIILLEAPHWRVLFSLAIVIWASARFYYFLFYVLEKYVDPHLKYAGIAALLRQICGKKHPHCPAPLSQDRLPSCAKSSNDESFPG